MNQTGFYRVMYDEDTWLSLISVLKSNHELFSSADRAGLIDDAFSLCRFVEKDNDLFLWRQFHKTVSNGEVLYDNMLFCNIDWNNKLVIFYQSMNK